ncbi:TPA: hypothetical protein ACPPAK_000800 [Haemophilus influenzae]
MKYIHLIVGLRPPYEVLGGCDEYIHFTVGLHPAYEVLGRCDEYIHFTVGLRSPYEVLGDVMNIFNVMDMSNIQCCESD